MSCVTLFCGAMTCYALWDAFRDDVLRGAVRLYGRRLHLVAVAVGGRCSDRAARHRWGKFSHTGGAVPCAQESSSLGVAMYDGEDRACSMDHAASLFPSAGTSRAFRRRRAWVEKVHCPIVPGTIL